MDTRHVVIDLGGEIDFIRVLGFSFAGAAAAVSVSVGNERSLTRSVFKHDNSISFNSKPWSSSSALNQNKTTTMRDAKRYTNTTLWKSQELHTMCVFTLLHQRGMETSLTVTTMLSLSILPPWKSSSFGDTILIKC
ncbi:hypothetical protein Bca4012_083308 [Brassica carinata]